MTDELARRYRETIEVMGKLYPTLEPQATRSMYEIIGTYASLHSFLGPFLDEHELSFGALGILITLRRSPGGTAPMPNVCKQLLVTRQNVSALVSGLVRRKLVDRIPSPDDARVRLLRITAAGKALLDRFLPAHYSRVANIFNVLREPEAALLADYLARIRRRVQELESPDNRQPIDD